MSLEFFATAAPGAEDLLRAELEELGAEQLRQRTGGVAFRGPLELGYRVCLWSRIAGRVLLPIAEFPAADADELYAGAHAIDWTAHLARGRSFAISATGHPTPNGSIDNTHFAALRVKDALVDQLRERWGTRPDVELETPDLRLRLHLRGDRATLSLDLAGEGLHRRGYRVASVVAPLRENLAAAVLLRCGAKPGAWPAIVDPMCGSATLLIEAAWIAGDVAPGLLRARWGFAGWVGHEPTLWRGLLDEAAERREAGRASIPRLVGYDVAPDSVRAAIACVEAAELSGVIHVERRELAQIEAPAEERGLVVCNPPWGQRLGVRSELEAVYAELGKVLRERFGTWQAAILTGDVSLGHSLGMRARRRNALQDGPIECQILRFDLVEANKQDAERRAKFGETGEGGARKRSEGATSFANRVAKNRKQLRKWIRREQISCHRIYNADIPEYNFAIDLYTEADSGLVHAHVQEYAPPATVDEKAARRRRGEALAVIREDLELPRERVHLKRRERQRGRAQYSKQGEGGQSFVVTEGDARLWVNLDDYLDTGLFLDHRNARAKVAAAAAGQRVLNLFCYTGSVSVHAALGQAATTTSVDLSATYLEWAARNFALNGLRCGGVDERGRADGRGGRIDHELVRDDVLEWVRAQGSRRWGLIFCDPPSFSNSKRMADTFDVQRDHVDLIRACVRLLEPGGQLWFSTNKRKFDLDSEALADLELAPLAGTISPDFSRSPMVHRCWVISRPQR